jgi:hypothetical protein
MLNPVHDLLWSNARIFPLGPFNGRISILYSNCSFLPALGNPVVIALFAMYQTPCQHCPLCFCLHLGWVSGAETPASSAISSTLDNGAGRGFATRLVPSPSNIAVSNTDELLPVESHQPTRIFGTASEGRTVFLTLDDATV